MKKTVSLIVCFTIVLMCLTAGFVYASSSNLTIPETAKVIEIREDNFNDCFEDVRVVKETEMDSSAFPSNMSQNEDNIVCKAQGFTSSSDLWKIDTGYSLRDIANELWFIQVQSNIRFINGQMNGIYDSKNNVLYYTTVNGTNGYVFSTIKGDGTMSVVKYDATSIGNPTVYKLKYMTARFKKLPYITVSYNGEMIIFDQKPVSENGRTLVPLRAIFEKIGADVKWNGDTQTVVATKDNTTISLTLNNTTAYKNGQPITLDVPAKAISGRTVVPVRFVADCFGVNVGWDGSIQRVILTK